ncbi:MAG: hypothetical protein PWQ57_913 [Desulfovibrionales bacterium]|jgi:hypothetical protein|nr:hypothetical protein [Desulfovibrionales bacterium]
MIQARQGLDQSHVEQYMAMIQHWLHERPSNDPERFSNQAAQAVWLEKRYWETMSKIMGASGRG